MTLDEAIAHCEEVVEQYEKICDTKLKVGLPNIYYDKDKSIKCAEEHRQLAEWLKNYKCLLDRRLMEKLKNCPNCGGVLDDSGRCMYCKSKVYDLTDINIDMDSNDIMLMKVKYKDQTMNIKVRPVNMSIKTEPLYNDFVLMDYKQRRIYMGNDVTINLELKGSNY